jgi:hypothetical protein
MEVETPLTRGKKTSEIISTRIDARPRPSVSGEDVTL